MNLIDAYVIKVIHSPIEAWGKWWVNVEVISYGIVTTTDVMCHTKEEADNIGVGHVFQF